MADDSVLRPLPSWFKDFSAASQRVLAEQNRHPLEKYHYVHNDRLHPLVFHLVTGFYSNRPPLFQHWYSNVKGLRLLDFASGRFSIGLETRRELILFNDQRYSGPFLRPDYCYAAGLPAGSPCYTMVAFRDGDRILGLSLKLNLSRESARKSW